MTRTIIFSIFTMSAILGCSTVDSMNPRGVNSANNEPVLKNREQSRSEVLTRLNKSEIPEPDDVRFDSELRHLAYCIRDGSDEYVICDGSKEPMFAKVNMDSFWFYNDGRSHIYTASRDGMEYVVKNGAVVLEGDSYADCSPYDDGKKAGAYAIRDGKNRLLLDDGTVMSAYAMSVCQNKQGYVYSATDEDGAFIIFDGEEERLPYDAVYYLCLSPDGEHISFTAEKNQEFFVVVDGVEIDRTGEPPWYISWRSDSRALGYIVYDASESYAKIAGIEGEKHYCAKDFAFAEHGYLWKYSAMDDGLWCAVVGDYRSDYFEHLEFFTFSEDGQRWYFRAKDGERAVLVVDGEEPRYHDVVKDVLFSPDSQRFTYVSEDNSVATVHVDGVQVASYPYVTGTVWSPDSSHYAFCAHEDESREIVVDGGTFASHQDSCGFLTFSPDSDRLAYVVYGDGEYVAVDGQIVSPCFEKIYRNVFNGEVIRFADDDTIRFMALNKNREIVSVEILLE